MTIINDLISSKIKMDRANDLRDNNLSQDDLDAIMLKVIQNAMVAQSSGSRKMQKRSIDEMKQIRQDIMTNNIKGGGRKKKKYMGRMTGLIDTMEGNFEEQGDDEKGGGAFEQIKSSIPDADTLISGLMTANPVLGYGAKMTKDLFTGVKKKRQQKKGQQQKRLEQLENVKTELEGQGQEGVDGEETGGFCIDDKTKELLRPKQLENVKTELEGQGQEGVYGEETGGFGSDDKTKGLLESINNEITQLRRIVGYNGNDSLQIVNENIEKSTDTQSELLQVEKERMEQQELQSIMERRQGGVEGEGVAGGGGRGGGFAFFGGIPDRIKRIFTGMGSVIKKIALAGTALAALAGTKTLGIITSFFKGIGKLFTGIIGLGKHVPKLLRIGGKLTGVGAIILAIWDFVDGFLNAGEFLGIEEGKVGIGDRIVSGILKINDGLMELADWVAGLFGFEIFGEEGREDIKNNIYGFYKDLKNWISDTFTSIMDFFKDFSITESMGNFSEWATDILSNMYKKIKEKLTDMINGAWDFIKDAPGNILEFGKDAGKNVVEGAKDLLGFSEDDDEQKDKVGAAGGAGVVLSALNPDNASELFSNIMKGFEQASQESGGNNSGQSQNVVANTDNRTINNNSILQGEKTSSNNETTLKNVRFMRNVNFFNN